MKGYIYITGTGTDPALKGNFNDPVFRHIPTLGACMPNIRRFVSKGDWIFVISGKIKSAQQYVVGGLRVSEKIDALSAYTRFPDNRLRIDDNGILHGNVIVAKNGKQHPLDTHDPASFDQRVKNFIVGDKAIEIDTEKAVARCREETLSQLSSIMGRPGSNSLQSAIGRCSKLDAPQIERMLDWLSDIKASD